MKHVIGGDVPPVVHMVEISYFKLYRNKVWYRKYPRRMKSYVCCSYISERGVNIDVPNKFSFLPEGFVWGRSKCDVHVCHCICNSFVLYATEKKSFKDGIFVQTLTANLPWCRFPGILPKWPDRRSWDRVSVIVRTLLLCALRFLAYISTMFGVKCRGDAKFVFLTES